MDESNEFNEILDRLDAENEILLLRILDVTRWMEESVSEQVACERRLSEIEAHRQSIEAELSAIHLSRTWRALMPMRRLYGRARSHLARP